MIKELALDLAKHFMYSTQWYNDGTDFRMSKDDYALYVEQCHNNGVEPVPMKLIDDHHYYAFVAYNKIEK